MSQEQAPSQEDLMRRAIELAQELLREGADPAYVSLALTNVGVDLGLKLTDNSIELIWGLLATISRQLEHNIRNDQEQEEGNDQSAELMESNGDAEVPEGAVIH